MAALVRSVDDGIKCVGPEGEAWVRVSEVLAEREDRLTGIKERTRVEVAQRVATVLALGLDAGRDEGGAPDSREYWIGSIVRAAPSLLSHGSITLRSGHLLPSCHRLVHRRLTDWCAGDHRAGQAVDARLGNRPEPGAIMHSDREFKANSVRGP